MLKSISALLGVGLVILWIAGLGSTNVPGWMTWLDGAAALCAFGISAYLTPYSSRASKISMPLFLAVGLFILWMVGVSNAVAPPWMSWWNFAFACGFLCLGIYGGIERRRLGGYSSGYPSGYQRPEIDSTGRTAPTTDLDRERTRRSA